MSDEEFEEAVEEALGLVPEQFLEAPGNVAVIVEDKPNGYHREALASPGSLGAATSCSASTAV